jgi:hypothetical protein
VCLLVCFQFSYQDPPKKPKKSYLSLSYNPVPTLTQPHVFFPPGQATLEFVSSAIATTTELDDAHCRRRDQVLENEAKQCA